MLADIQLSGAWTPTNVLILIVAAGYVAVMIINAVKGNPQQQDLLKLLQALMQSNVTLQQQHSQLMAALIASRPNSTVTSPLPEKAVVTDAAAA